MRTSFIVLIAAALVPVFDHTCAAQDQLGFLTGVLGNVRSITVAEEQGLLLNNSDLTTDGSDCSLGGLCGMAAEVLIDIASPRGYDVELGFGASYLRGFREKAGSPVELRGSVRSFPTISAYITESGHRADRGIDPYFGVNFGISDLWNLQAYDGAGKEYAVKGQTFDYGLTAGMYVPVYRSFGIFGEAGYRRRRFASVDWSSDTPPTGGPRSLNFDALTFSLGVQVRIKDDPRPPAFAGTWALTRLDGKELPGIYLQAPSAGGGSMRDEVIAGMLSIHDSRFTITLSQRTSTLNPGGQVVAIAAPVSQQIVTGTAHINAGADSLTLTPDDAQGKPLPTRRIDSELSVEVGGHILLFRRIGG